MWQIYQTFSNRDALRSQLSWTHYRLLMRIEKEEARNFYVEEAISEHWSTRTLERQINSFYYERLLASKDKKPVVEEATKNAIAIQPEEVIKKSSQKSTSFFIASMLLRKQADKIVNLLKLIDYYKSTSYKNNQTIPTI